MWQYHMAEWMEVLNWEKILLLHNYVCASITFSAVMSFESGWTA